MFANRVIGGYTVPCVVIFIICVLVIILYGYFLRKTKTQDFLAKRIFHHPICQDEGLLLIVRHIDGCLLHLV